MTIIEAVKTGLRYRRTNEDWVWCAPVDKQNSALLLTYLLAYLLTYLINYF